MDLGSFTGVRIGIATIKGLALILNVPTVGVSTDIANTASEIGKHGLELYKNGKLNDLTPIYTPSYVERLPNGTS